MSELRTFRFYMNGERLDDVAIEGVSLTLHESDPGEFLGKEYVGGYTRIEASAVAPVSDWQRLLYSLTPPVRRVSALRLLERAWYGGRKGRSALRRLRRMHPDEQRVAAACFLAKHHDLRLT